MNKKIVSALLCGTMVLATATPALAGEADGQKIALVGKSAGNAFFEIAAASFKETVEAEGGEVEVVYPEAATADAQIKVLDNLISQDFDAICISANDVNALQAKLEEAMDEGIKVSSFDSAPNADSRQVFVNQDHQDKRKPCIGYQTTNRCGKTYNRSNRYINFAKNQYVSHWQHKKDLCQINRHLPEHTL